MKKSLFREMYTEPIGRVEPEIEPIEPEIVGILEEKPKKTTRKRKVTK